MNSSGRSQNCLRVLVAPVVFAAFLAALLLSASPELHQRIHPDANRVDHNCAVTMIGSGSYDHAAQPPPIIAPDQVDRFGNAALTSTWVTPLFLSAHIFAHAPPAHS